MKEYRPQAAVLSKQEIAAALQQCAAHVRADLPTYTDKFKYSHAENGVYPATENVEWTTGFWTGEIWLAYEATGDEAFRTAALRQVDSFLARIENQIDVNHHDMGFLYSPSCVAAWQLTGSETGRKAALLAADHLIARFQQKGQFIQAWGDLGSPDNYRLIIDCLLNMPLLYWATEETGNATYADIATRHIHTALQYIMRPDCSTYHTYFFDPTTGAPVRGVTAQGFRDGSVWARGQAWGIYGTALAYRYTRDASHLETFEKITDFFLDSLPEDLIPFWDFDFCSGSTEPRDSSASAIAVCGMLEAAQVLPPEKAAYYTQAAEKLLCALVQHCAVLPGQGNGLLAHGTYARQSPFNTCKNRGVDESNIWGDYYYIEALTRCHGPWKPYW